jgi:hypothetical protein
LCSPEHGKLCFEAPETRVSASKPLALPGLENPSEVRVLCKHLNGFVMEENNNNKRNKGGRTPKDDPSIHRYVFRLTDEENARLLSLFEASGMPNKAKFIISHLFGKEMKTVKIDKGTADFYMRLTSFHSQFRAVGVNYNQVVKLLYSHFSEKKAAAYLYKLEKQTAEFAALCQKIIQLAEEFEANHLKKQP